MRQTPTNMHMHHMVTIGTKVFEIVGRIVNFLKYTGLDRVNASTNPLFHTTLRRVANSHAYGVIPRHLICYSRTHAIGVKTS